MQLKNPNLSQPIQTDINSLSYTINPQTIPKIMCRADTDGFVEVKFSRRQKKQHSKFCKVCFDAGKSEAEYTNHFVRSKQAKDAPVVCPTLLALECNYCHKHGHTIGYCPMLKNQQHDGSDSSSVSSISTTRSEETKKLKQVLNIKETETETTPFIPVSVMRQTSTPVSPPVAVAAPAPAVAPPTVAPEDKVQQMFELIKQQQTQILLLEQSVSILNEKVKLLMAPSAVQDKKVISKHKVCFASDDDEELGWGDIPMSDEE